MTTAQALLDCGCRVGIDITYDYIDEFADVENIWTYEQCHLHKTAPQLLELLDEWRRTPYFDNHSDWAEWVGNFGIRVDVAIDAATGGDNAQ